jgi:predicted methyltransferase
MKTQKIWTLVVVCLLMTGIGLLGVQSAAADREQEKADPRLAEWAKLPPPEIEKMKPFLGVWESIRKSDGQVGSVTTFEIRDGAVYARHRTTPAGAEPFQLEVQFIKVLDRQTLQWGLRNPSMGVILHTAKLIDENTLQGTSEPVGIPQAPPPSNFSLKRQVGSRKPAPNVDKTTVGASSQESDYNRRRDDWQRPAEVIDALAVKPGQRVADLGSGSGYFTFRLAARVGSAGKVYAVDIDEEAINKVRLRKEREKLQQIEAILSESADPRLPSELDSVLIVDSYHEFREYDQTLQAVFRALKPGGRLVIIDGEAPSGRPRTEYHRLHSIPAELVREEVARHGFIFKETRPGFYDPDYGKKMYFLIFEKPKSNSTSWKSSFQTLQQGSNEEIDRINKI